MWDSKFEGILRPHLPLLKADQPIASELGLRDVGVDSLALIELLVTVEDTYEVEFPDELLTADTFRTVGTLWDAVCTLLDRVDA